MPDPDELLTVAKAAHELGLTPTTVHRLIHRGQMTADRVDGIMRLRKADIDRWIEGQRVKPGDLATWYSRARPKTQQRSARQQSLLGYGRGAGEDEEESVEPVGEDEGSEG